jgi:hypothetical protein
MRIFDRVTLLVSNRSDIEKIFGQPVKPFTSIYHNSDFRITARYSLGRCNETAVPGIYNVPKDVVWKLIISPEKPFPVSELWARHREKFDRGIDPKFPSIVYYTNIDSSIIIQTELTNKIEDVHVITYAPGRDAEKLRCVQPKSS